MKLPPLPCAVLLVYHHRDKCEALLFFLSQLRSTERYHADFSASKRLQTAKSVWISIRFFPLGQALLFQFFFQLSNLRHKKRYRPGRHFVNPRMPPLKSLRQQCPFCHACRYRPGSPEIVVGWQANFYSIFFWERGCFFFLMGRNSLFTLNLYSPYIFEKNTIKTCRFLFPPFSPPNGNQRHSDPLCLPRRGDHGAVRRTLSAWIHTFKVISNMVEPSNFWAPQL